MANSNLTLVADETDTASAASQLVYYVTVTGDLKRASRPFMGPEKISPRVITEDDLEAGPDGSLKPRPPRDDWRSAMLRETIVEQMVAAGCARDQALADSEIPQYVEELMDDSANAGGNLRAIWDQRCGLIISEMARVKQEIAQVRERVLRSVRERLGEMAGNKPAVGSKAAAPQPAVTPPKPAPAVSMPTVARPPAVTAASLPVFNPAAKPKSGSLKQVKDEYGKAVEGGYAGPKPFQVFTDLQCAMATRWVFADAAFLNNKRHGEAIWRSDADNATTRAKRQRDLQDIINAVNAVLEKSYGMDLDTCRRLVEAHKAPCSRAVRNTVQQELQADPAFGALLSDLKPITAGNGSGSASAAASVSSANRSGQKMDCPQKYCNRWGSKLYIFDDQGNLIGEVTSKEALAAEIAEFRDAEGANRHVGCGRCMGRTRNAATVDKREQRRCERRERDAQNMPKANPGGRVVFAAGRKSGGGEKKGEKGKK